MDRERHSIYCRQLATFEMKADGEVFQLQNGVSHAMSPSLTRMTGRKAPQQRRFWRGGCCTRQIVRPCQGQNVRSRQHAPPG